MNTQDFHTLARPPSSRRLNRWSTLQLFNYLIVLFLTAVIVLDPSPLHRPGAAFAAGDAQGPVAQAACYGVYHIVRPGQTIYSIAAAYGTTAYRIATCNRYGYTVYVRQSLLIPTYRPYRGG
jgi:hypothetical protein